MLKDVRVWFVKDGPSRYISHLDLNRCMSKVIKRSKLPVWYTEGFNPHLFITFSLPLSLGMRGKKEFMDIRLLEELPKLFILESLNKYLPEGIQAIDVTEPILKLKNISYALFNIQLEPVNNNIDFNILKKEFENFFNSPEIIVEKRCKSGQFKSMNIKEDIVKYNVYFNNESIINILVTLPAGNSLNINPILLVEGLKKYSKMDYNIDISRLELYDEKMIPFR